MDGHEYAASRQLLEEYPDALREENILNKYQELKKYAKDNKTAINNLYSYYNSITITSYNSTAGGILLSKEELKLKLDKEGIGCISMMEMDSTMTNIYVRDKNLIKHL